MDATDAGRGRHRITAAMRWYASASLTAIVLYPFLPEPWAGVAQFAVFAGATVCVAIGRHRVVPNRRHAWTLLLCSFVIFSVANIVLSLPADRADTVGRFIDATGYLLLLAAALAFVARCGSKDLGGVLVSAVMAFAVGGVLWILLPHRIGADSSFRAQFELFVVLFAITGALGALVRLTTGAVEKIPALGWLQVAVFFVIAGNILFSLAGASRAGTNAAIMLLLTALTATGLFGLDPSAPRVAYSQAVVAERLSVTRLVFLGLAVAAIPVVAGVRYMLGGDFSGALVAIASPVVAALVMARISLLSAERDLAEQRLAYQATHDSLTGLPNRREFAKRLRHEVERGAHCVLLFCDLDGFKTVNDRFGHDAGDTVLVEVAQRINTCVRDVPHVVSRLGGDEFVVLLVDVTRSEEQAVTACISAELSRRLAAAGGVEIGVSIGVATTNDTRDPERLLQYADQAMYRMKALHRRGIGSSAGYRHAG